VIEASFPPITSALLLLLSSAALTWAHATRAALRRRALLLALGAAILLALGFIVTQAIDAATLTYGFVYPRLGDSSQALQPVRIPYVALFMLIGYHGYVVLAGIALLAALCVHAALRAPTPNGSRAFDAVAWSWHGIDVLWLLLFAGLILATAGMPTAPS
jgi:heme/copper-type cytochrome/quinol oxidase subunit 3